MLLPTCMKLSHHTEEQLMVKAAHTHSAIVETSNMIPKNRNIVKDFYVKVLSSDGRVIGQKTIDSGFESHMKL